MDALNRRESCGGHFREESQDSEGEAKRDDENFQYVAAWEHTGDVGQSVLHKEELEFVEVKPTTRSYK
jgi:succinate dehydrogenase / fumarate reductase flavoprotein subunit